MFISAGLSQEANEREHYQNRIVDFESFPAGVGLEGATIRPRTSRDFLLEFVSVDATPTERPVLDRIRRSNVPLFMV